jgi:hypothetical protein
VIAHCSISSGDPNKNCILNVLISYCVLRMYVLFILNSDESTVFVLVAVAHYVSKVPLHEFDVLWNRCYTAYEIDKYPFVAIFCGITSIQSFIIFFAFILLLENSSLSTSFAYGSD